MDDNKLIVVFADDDGPIRDALVECMCDAGFDVRPCKDGSDAVRLCEEIKPDVVVLDLNMPGMDGYETARAIRRNTALNAVRLIALTGFGSWDARREAFNAGFNEFLTKPIPTADLIRALRPRDRATR
jgi:CheY-like chemotaxis protein